MQTQTAQVGPVTLSERILFIDVLRGLALFGILTANMRAFNAPVDAYMHIGVLFHGRADVIAEGVVDAVFQGKFISIFSFLFGLGFAMQMSRAEARGVGFLSFYPRRLAALALFGIIHGMLIWSGDILFTYALSGTVLLPPALDGAETGGHAQAAHHHRHLCARQPVANHGAELRRLEE
jgi:uncharacterized protein